MLPEINESLFLENSLKIYLSKYKTKEDRDEKRELYIAFIVALEMSTRPGDVMKCRQLPSGDVIAVFTNEKMRKQLLEYGRIVIQQGNQNVNVLVGPVGREGEINYAKYLIQVTLPAEVGIEAVTEALSSKCKIVEIIVDNTIRNMNTWYAVHFSPESKCKIYGEFRRLEDAIDLPEEIIIRGKRIYLNHAASLYCETCGQIGHNSEGHMKIEQRRQERIRIDCIRRKKKEEEKKKRVATAADTLALRMKLEEDKHNNSTYADLISFEEKKKENQEIQVKEDTHGPRKRTPIESGMDAQATKWARRAENKVTTIAHVNAYEIKQKKQQIKQFLEDTNAEILGVSETHCSEADLLPSIDGYSWLHNPGSERSSGVGILFKKRLVTGETKLFMKGKIVGTSIANLTVIEAYSGIIPVFIACA